jgi:hypothetical protein
VTDKKHERGFLDTVAEMLEDAADMLSLGSRIVSNAKDLSADKLKDEIPGRAQRISQSRKKEK